MHLIWTSEATDDFENLIEETVHETPEAAASLYKLVRDTADRIANHPFMFRRGRLEGTRESVVHGHYTLVYEVLQDAVRVLAILPARPG